MTNAEYAWSNLRSIRPAMLPVALRGLARWPILAAMVWVLCLASPPLARAVLASGASEGPCYVVRKGDTLSAIGRRHDLSVERLMLLNNLHSDLIKPGQSLFLEGPASVAGIKTTQATDQLKRVIESYLATPYRFGGTGKDGIDCSAFVQQVYRALEINLPRSTREQYRYGKAVELLDLRSGDLLFFRTYAQYPSHVGIYLGNGTMAHASGSSHRVVASEIDRPYYIRRFIGAKRVLMIDPAPLDLGSHDLEIETPIEDEAAAEAPGTGTALARGVAR